MVEVSGRLRRFDGKVVFVTGGGDGIGRASALRLASEGATVGIATLHQAKADVVASEIRSLGSRVATHFGDLADPEVVRSAHESLVDELGSADIIVNNVGVGIGVPFVDSDDEVFERTLAINFMAAVRLTRYALPAMIARGSGSIVNVGSAQGIFGWPGFSAYSASKGAMMSWSRQLANEYGARGIRSNTVIPGAVLTPMNEKRIATEEPDYELRSTNLHIIPRFQRPEEVAAAVAFLASDDASFITATELYADGGTTAKAHWYA